MQAAERPEATPSLSVVIPVLDDRAALARLLPQLARAAPGAEVVVADGGRAPGLSALTARHGAALVQAPRGRGVQMNAGAAATRGEVLWFLHADVEPPEGADRAISGALGDAGVVGGAFGFRLRERTAYAPWLDATVNLRSRVFGLPYGDQGLFVRRTVFDRLGGFRPLPLMEDVELVRRLGRVGRLALLDPVIRIAARRWRREGFFRVTIRNQILLAAYLAGVPVDRLAAHYPVVREEPVVREGPGARARPPAREGAPA